MTEQLTPKNLMPSKVRKMVNKHQLLASGDRIIVAVSGGADSVALLYGLLPLVEELACSLYVVHVNHLLRGAAAEADANFVAQLSARHQLPFSIRQVDVASAAKGMNTSKQNVARILRYQVLEEEALKWGANKIALGHHADDQAETILLHLLRGTGLEGLAGMLPMRDQKYIRPLLEVTREEIEAFCDANDLSYCTDLSNFEPVYLRNKIRLDLLPLLKEAYNPAVVKGLGRLAKLASEENEFLAEQAQQAFAQVCTGAEPNRLTLDSLKLTALPLALQRRVLILAWQQLAQQHTNLEFDRVEEAIQLAKFGHTGQGLGLPGLIRLEKSYHNLILQPDFGHNAIEKQFSYPIPVPGQVQIPELGVCIRAELSTKQSEQVSGATQNYNTGTRVCWDADQMDFPLIARNRRMGDRFHPQGAPGHKKLKEFFIDAKVPKESRAKTLLVCDSKEVLWAVGIRVAEACWVTAKTTRILELTVEKAPNIF